MTVGHYQATNIRAASNLGCKAARTDLSLWLKQPTKLPHNPKSWHAKLVKGTWQMAYGKYPTSLYFVLVNLTSAKPTPAAEAAADADSRRHSRRLLRHRRLRLRLRRS